MTKHAEHPKPELQPTVNAGDINVFLTMFRTMTGGFTHNDTPYSRVERWLESLARQ